MPPPILEFFTQRFVNKKSRIRDFVDPIRAQDFALPLLEKLAGHFIDQFESIPQDFRFHRSAYSIHHAAGLAAVSHPRHGGVKGDAFFFSAKRSFGKRG